MFHVDYISKYDRLFGEIKIYLVYWKVHVRHRPHHSNKIMNQHQVVVTYKANNAILHFRDKQLLLPTGPKHIPCERQKYKNELCGFSRPGKCNEVIGLKTND